MYQGSFKRWRDIMSVEMGRQPPKRRYLCREEFNLRHIVTFLCFKA